MRASSGHIGENQRKLSLCKDCKLCIYLCPNWPKEAYSDVLSILDVGISERAIDTANILTVFCFGCINNRKKFLNSAGGMGLLTRKFRACGFNWYSTDPLASSTISLGEI